MSGILYLVGTSIGNLEDVTLRALRILREVDLVAAEDTRVAMKLFSRYDIHTPTVSYHQHSGLRKIAEIIEKLMAGQNVALISDAGMPGISDPGQDLIRKAIEQGIPIVPIPGANAAVTVVATSGLSESGFSFVGYPPRRQGDRLKFFGQLKSRSEALVFYEAPRRLLATLESALSALGDRQTVIGREVTKLHEEIFRGALTQAIEHFSAGEIRGEVTIVIAGVQPGEEEAPAVDAADALKAALDSGLSDRDAVKQVSEALGLPRRQVYGEMLRLKKSERR